MVLLIFVNFCLFIKIFAILSKKKTKKKQKQTPNKSQMSYKCEWVLAVPPIL